MLCRQAQAVNQAQAAKQAWQSGCSLVVYAHAHDQQYVNINSDSESAIVVLIECLQWVNGDERCCSMAEARILNTR